jgi:hypothetical protein
LKEYSNRNLKTQAYKKLINVVKTVYPEANREWVMNRIQSLRGLFRKELKKVQESKKSGSSADAVNVPSLWYYDLLLFTRDQEEPEESISNLEEREGYCSSEVGDVYQPSTPTGEEQKQIQVSLSKQFIAYQ